MKNVYALCSFLMLFTSIASAQTSRHIIQIRDKNGTPYTLANPSAYLSAKAIARRTIQNIAIDSTDLPINPAYLESIRNIPNVTVLNRSKWLNQVLVRITDPAALTTINALPFVRSSSLIAPLSKGGRSIDKSEEIFPLPDRTTTVNGTKEIKGTLVDTLLYGSTINQIKIHKGEYLHNRGFTGRNINFAILDAGFFAYLTNPNFDSVRLQNRILGVWDYVANEESVNEDNTHGAYCFGIIAGNQPGVYVGSAPHASFWLLRTEDVNSEYPVEEQNWVAAAEFADSAGVDMISSSLGYADFDNPAFNHPYSERNGNTSMITRAADLAAKKGILVMNSAGNSGAVAGDGKYIICPADGDSVFTVGATDVNGNIASFSSWGPSFSGKVKPNVVSVGQGTAITLRAGTPTLGNGTSFSNPNLAGLVACLWQAFPEFKNMDIIDAVQRSSHKYLNPDARFGYGIPDFRKAFHILLSKSTSSNLQNNSCVNQISWTGKDDTSMSYTIERQLTINSSFTPLATIKSTSTGFKKNNYSFSDTLKSPIQGQLSYRIRLNINGDTSFVFFQGSYQHTALCFARAGYFFTPNPFKNDITAVLNTPAANNELNILFYDITGRLVHRYKGSKPQGYFTTTIPTTHLAPGVYIARILLGNEVVYTQKIVK